MKRFLLGLLTALLTLAAILVAGLLLAEDKTEAPPPEATVPATEVTSLPTAAPEETEPLPPAAEAPEKITVDSVPLYYQTDYPHIKFGNNTIATSGCSVTCLAMVATWMTDETYTPPQMAYHFGDYGKNNIERLDYGIARMQLPYERTEDIRVVLQALREGKVAILMMDEESVFTAEQHFIVAAGINESGKIIVNDPLETNYQNADVPVRNCYDKGFDDFYLMRGFSGGWIFDKADMPSVPFLYDASMPEEQENRYQGYVLTEEDIYTLACFLYVEGRNEAAEIQQAMAEVVLNRIVSPDYPNTLQKVLHQTELYRAVPDMKYVTEPDLTQYRAVDAAMYGPYVLPANICFYSQWEKGKEPWGSLGTYTFYQSR